MKSNTSNFVNTMVIILFLSSVFFTIETKGMMELPSLGIGKVLDWAGLRKKHVYHFHEGSADEKELLGNKGANLCEMFRLGLPVPHGFVISTETCVDFFKQKIFDLDEHLMYEIQRAVHEIEKQTGKKFAPQTDLSPMSKATKIKTLPLLLSVRSGAAVSMPGMMDTILNLGMNEDIVHIMAKVSNNLRWAYDTYRRFLQMYGTVVLHVDKERYEDVLADARKRRGVSHDSLLTDSDLIQVATDFRGFTVVPEDPWEQLRCAVRAVFMSWNSPRAIKYRDIHNISQGLGTGVVVQTMVYGNLNNRSGSGVCFTRNPATGEKRLFGEYLVNAEGEDVVSGVRTPLQITELANEQGSVYETLVHIEKLLEKHYRNMQDIEFTIENGVLYILQTRNGKRTAQAAVRIAIDMVNEKLISEREALMRIEAKQMNYFLHPMLDQSYVNSHRNEVEENIIGTGLAASAGAAFGKIVFTNEEAADLAAKGQCCILCRHDTSADDIGGLKAAEGVLTTHGGLTSHAAVVMRGMGKTAVTGARDIIIDVHNKLLKTRDGKLCLSTGDLITIDGSTGYVYRGEMPTVSSGHSQDFQTILQWADKYKNMHVLANADTAEEAKKALELGAEGIGLCRTEHMFFKEDRLKAFRQMILSETPQERQRSLEFLHKVQEEDFYSIFSLMHNRQVTVRLLDPPMHEFLPSPGKEGFEEEVQHLAQQVGMSVDDCKHRIFSLQEKNPMLGFRGCRLAIIHPEIMKMQVKAIIGAMIKTKRERKEVFLQIMIPLVFSDHEIDMLMPGIEVAMLEICDQMCFDISDLNVQLGTMIEVPRACLRANKIAAARNISFVSFGTNDLTQLMFGMSRDDTQQFMPTYVSNHIVARDPFVSIDTHGVGPLMHMAIKRSRDTNPSIKIGVCGEHGGDPASINFFYYQNVDYVSCSPYRVPIAKVAAAQSRIEYIAHKQALEEARMRSLMGSELILY